MRSAIWRLVTIRWAGQLTDGLFQSALASFVLFSPERQPDAFSAAAAFAVVLLPYSIIGPLVGTVLDRFSRQRIILITNLLRAILLLVISGLVRSDITGLELTAVVLLAFGVNRLILAGLSASLPLLLDSHGAHGRTRLVSINALAVTGGTVCVVIGGGLGIGIRKFFNSSLSANSADALLLSIASALYGIVALLTLILPKQSLGPLPHEIKKVSVLGAFQEMREGYQFLRAYRDCFLGIIATGIQRGGLTALTLMALLLNRNTFHDPLRPEEGLAGFATAVTAAGIGVAIGAFIAPMGVARFGRHLWIRISLIAGALPMFTLSIKQVNATLLLTGFLAALVGQGVKVTNDALVQSTIADEFRGRVFAVYDVMVNSGIVGGALLAALILPASGLSALLPALVAITYIAMGLLLLRKKSFNSDYHSTI